MEKDGTDVFYERLKRARAESKKKREIINRHFPSVWGLVSFLLMRLPNEKIEEIGGKYRNKEYLPDELLRELLTLCGYDTSAIRDLLGFKQFTLSDMKALESNMNDQRILDSHRLTEERLQILQRLKNISEGEKSQLKEEIQKLQKNLERYKKFDRTKYDRSIFVAATKRYELAVGYDKHYGRCLLAELKERQIADDKYEEGLEFMYWENAFRQHRHEENLKKRQKNKLKRTNKKS